MQHIVETNERLAWIRRLQRNVNEMVGANSSQGRTMVYLVNTALAAQTAARLATKAMNEEAAEAAAKAALHAQSAAWSIHDAACDVAGRWIPGQPINKSEDEILDEMYETELQQAWEERYNVG